MRRILALTWLLVAFAGCGPAKSPPPARPNILLLVVDDLRFDALSATGQPPLPTPHMDRLVEEGALFPDAFVSMSLCSPSRATIFTGLRADQHNVTGLQQQLAEDVPLVSERLEEAGYETAYVGKWHLNFDGQPARGFEHWVSFTTAATYFDPQIVREWSVSQMRGHMTDILTDHALYFLRHRGERPFFLTLSHLAVHEPYQPQPRFDALLDTVRIRLPDTVNRIEPGQPEWLQCHARAGFEWVQRTRQYYELVAGVDESVGKVLAELEREGVLDDTLILLIGDNGQYLGEHGLGDKRSAYEESMRVPLAVRYPRQFPAQTRVEGALALNLDVTPTLLRAAGLAIPDSLSGLPLQELLDHPSARPSFGFCYLQPAKPRELEVCTPDIRAIRTRRFKLITYPGTAETPELYDLQRDPHEIHNVFTDGGYRALADSLQQMLASMVFPGR